MLRFLTKSKSTSSSVPLTPHFGCEENEEPIEEEIARFNLIRQRSLLEENPISGSSEASVSRKSSFQFLTSRTSSLSTRTSSFPLLPKTSSMPYIITKPGTPALNQIGERSSTLCRLDISRKPDLPLHNNNNNNTAKASLMAVIRRKTLGFTGFVLVPQTRTIEMEALESSLLETGYFQVLFHLLPDLRAERMLCLTRAIQDLCLVSDTELVKKRVYASRAHFIQEGSNFGIDDVPPVLLQNLEDSSEPLLLYLLQELLKLPEVLDTLNVVSFAENPENMLTPHHAAFTETDTEANSECVSQDVLVRVIADLDLRRQLLQNLMSSSSKSNLLVKIRFVAAVDQCLTSEDRVKLEKSIRNIFLTPSGMFSLGSYSKNIKLETIRALVLRELCFNSEVRLALAKIDI